VEMCTNQKMILRERPIHQDEPQLAHEDFIVASIGSLEHVKSADLHYNLSSKHGTFKL
jgi:hypothetical protein